MPDDKLMKLDGQIIKSTGDATLKTKFLQFLDFDLDEYKEPDYTPEEATKIRKHMSHLSTGAASALPLLCQGQAKCPFAQRCPFVKVDQFRKKQYDEACAAGHGRFVDPPKYETPVGKSCLVEVNLLNEWTRLYVGEFGVPDESFIELGMCRELAEIEVMLWRVNNNLAKPEHAEMIQETLVAVDKEGNPLYRKEEDCLLATKERLNNRKSKLTKLMVGDRQEKYKQEAALKVKVEKDPSSSAAHLRSEITRLIKKAENRVLELAQKEGSIIDAQFTEKKEEILTPQSLIDDETE